MVSVQPPPRRRELPYARVLLPPAIVMAAATGAAVAVVAHSARLAVGLCGGIATLLVVLTAAEAARRGRALRAQQDEHARRSAQLEQRLADRDQVLVVLTEEILPTALHMTRKGLPPREVFIRLERHVPAFRQLGALHASLLRQVLKAVDSEAVMRDGAQRSFVHVAQRVQAIVHQQAKELREMEEDHGRNHEVFQDLLRIDHGNALIGRLADTVSVLGGGRPARQWPQPVALYSVLRGAMSRILEYKRIDLKSIAKVNIKGTAVEPIIHACAEILDNATRYSPPTTQVHVTAHEVQYGVAIEMEDCGPDLNEESRLRLEGLLEKAMDGTDLEVITDIPQLGFAVVGRLCKEHNMQISLRSSAYGGLRAVLVVPRNMMTDEPGVLGFVPHGIGAQSVADRPKGALAGPARKPKIRRPTNPRIPATVSMEDDIPVVTEWTEQGLPQRRSRVKTPLSQRIAEEAAFDQTVKEAAERAAERARQDPWAPAEPEPEPEPEKELPPPGLWVESFWAGLRKNNPGDPTAFTRNPTAYLHLLDENKDDKDETARTEADDEGDLT
ncbi:MULTISPECIES: ATP-binding protein [unclassified Streptomyces]|uniref:ATP-binding protein n=1 Tax=unclassified Streptomyces TaxID=2593676 RepID=UPI0009612CD5|nr:ATP-binding protein [Streptomyces sp. TSRI0107]OKJ82400.1 ATPase [Streptomyces sp. TSRI0107]